MHSDIFQLGLHISDIPDPSDSTCLRFCFENLDRSAVITFLFVGPNTQHDQCLYTIGARVARDLRLGRLVQR
jgi:hypothetical protein